MWTEYINFIVFASASKRKDFVLDLSGMLSSKNWLVKLLERFSRLYLFTSSLNGMKRYSVWHPIFVSIFKSASMLPFFFPFFFLSFSLFSFFFLCISVFLFYFDIFLSFKATERGAKFHQYASSILWKHQWPLLCID